MHALSWLRGRSERGAVLALGAAAIPLLVGLGALVVDLGYQQALKVQLQNAADAAVLAAGPELPADNAAAISVAGQYAVQSLGGVTATEAPCGADTMCFTTGSAVVKVTSPYSVPSASYPPEEVIHVVACAERSSFFASFLGTHTLKVCASATGAGWSTPSSGECALCLLRPDGTTLNQTGAGTVDVVGGSIVVNSTHSESVKLTGSGSVSSDGTFGLNGGYSAPTGALTPIPSPASPVADPFAALPEPSLAGSPLPKVSISGSASVTVSPGIYSELVSSSTGQITLEPGIYVITREIKLNKSPNASNQSLLAHGVMVYFACANYPLPCAPGENGGKLTLTGGATIDWTPPATGPYAGMSIFGDRNNVSELILTGSSGSAFSGSIYMRDGTLSMTGPSGVDTNFDAIVAIGALKKTGDSSVVIDTTSGGGPSASTSGHQLIG